MCLRGFLKNPANFNLQNDSNVTVVTVIVAQVQNELEQLRSLWNFQE